MTAPLVGVIVVNYQATELTMECLTSLAATDWPADRLEVVLVDNSDDVLLRSRLADERPEVRRISSGGNVGFAAACDIGFRALRHADHVALVNNDAVVCPGWLAPLVETLETDAGIGAAVPKILLRTPFRPLPIAGGPVELTRLEVGGRDVLRRVAPGRGCTRRADPDELGRFTLELEADAELLVPVERNSPDALDVVIRATGVRDLRIGLDRGPVVVGTEPARFSVSIPGPGVDLINNLGTDVGPGGFGTDRRFREVDDGRFDEPADVVAFSGGGVLLAGRFLEEVGLFDPRFFTYYEDVDLAWRGRRAGWRYRTSPSSVIRHLHTATTTEGSPSFWFHNDRNRLLTLARNASARALLAATVGHLRGTVSIVRHQILRPLVRRRRPSTAMAVVRIRAVGSFLRLLPATLRTRSVRASRRIGAS